MSTITIENAPTFENFASTQPFPGWRETNAYRLHILIVEDEEGSFSAISLNLPGVGSCGDTKEEALENVKEAAAAVLEEYKTSGMKIPWEDSRSATIPPGASQQWIVVDA